MDVVVEDPSSASVRSVRYAFGGTPAAPLVERVVHVSLAKDAARGSGSGSGSDADGSDGSDEEDEEAEDREAGLRLEMHDAVLEDIAQVFDGALATLDDTTKTLARRGNALDIMVGAIEYGSAVLAADISVKYSAFFQRTQAVLQRLPAIAAAFGRVAVEDVKRRLDGPWNLLLGIAKLYSVVPST